MSIVHAAFCCASWDDLQFEDGYQDTSPIQIQFCKIRHRTFPKFAIQTPSIARLVCVCRSTQFVSDDCRTRPIAEERKTVAPLPFLFLDGVHLIKLAKESSKFCLSRSAFVGEPVIYNFYGLARVDCSNCVNSRTAGQTSLHLKIRQIAEWEKSSVCLI